MIRTPRAVFRFLVFVFVGVVGPLDSWFRDKLTPGGITPLGRYRWAILWSAVLRWNFGIRMHMHGGQLRDEAQVIVSNHLGYLDIICFLRAGAMNFVSKYGVKEWPLVGALAKSAGTLFLRREKRGDIPRVLASFDQIIDSGSRVIFFPEGTSSGGESVLPFHSSLFQMAAQKRWKIQTAAIYFEIGENDPGEASERVCYWGDMEFVPHFKQMMFLDRIECHIYIRDEIFCDDNRKALASQLHEVVSENLTELKSRASGIVTH